MWCQRAFYKDALGNPTLNAKEAVSCDLIGQIKRTYSPQDYVQHVINIAELLGAEKGRDYVSAFMYLVAWIDAGGDQQWAWVQYTTKG